jgi:tetratricopeptide (TPR) repeat protein
MPHEEETVQQLIRSCKEKYVDNAKTLALIEELGREVAEVTRRSDVVQWLSLHQSVSCREISAALTESFSIVMDRVSILFVVTIHPKITSYPFADIQHQSCFGGEEEIHFYEKALHIHQLTLPANYPLPAILYNNVVVLYGRMGEYSEAHSFHEKSVSIRQENLPASHPDLAISYNNLGAVYIDMAEYSKALVSQGRSPCLRNH